MTTRESPPATIDKVTEELYSLLAAVESRVMPGPPLNLWAEMLETVVGRERFDERGHQLEKGVVRSVASEMRAFLDGDF